MIFTPELQHNTIDTSLNCIEYNIEYNIQELSEEIGFQKHRHSAVSGL